MDPRFWDWGPNLFFGMLMGFSDGGISDHDSGWDDDQMGIYENTKIFIPSAATPKPHPVQFSISLPLESI